MKVEMYQNERKNEREKEELHRKIEGRRELKLVIRLNLWGEREKLTDRDRYRERVIQGE